MTSILASIHVGERQRERDCGKEVRHVYVCVRGLIPTAETWQTGGLNINKPHMALLFCRVPRWKATAALSTKTNTSVARHAAGGLHFNAFVGFPKYASISSWMGSLQVHKARWRLSFKGQRKWAITVVQKGGRRMWRVNLPLSYLKNKNRETQKKARVHHLQTLSHSPKP